MKIIDLYYMRCIKLAGIGKIPENVLNEIIEFVKEEYFKFLNKRKTNKRYYEQDSSKNFNVDESFIANYINKDIDKFENINFELKLFIMDDLSITGGNEPENKIKIQIYLPEDNKNYWNEIEKDLKEDKLFHELLYYVQNIINYKLSGLSYEEYVKNQAHLFEEGTKPAESKEELINQEDAVDKLYNIKEKNFNKEKLKQRNLSLIENESKANPEDKFQYRFSRYLTNPDEFRPFILTEVNKYKNKFRDDKSKIREFIGEIEGSDTSLFFKEYKHYNEKMWRIAIKEFYKLLNK